MNNIKDIVNNNLCISCGCCEAVCPKKCIKLVKENGMFLPKIDNNCVDCGQCLKICTGNSIDFSKDTDYDEKINMFVGKYKKIYNAKTQNLNLLKNATSGGVTTQIIKTLLDEGIYTSAFCIDTYNYSNKIIANRFTKNDDLSKTTKSRYIAVSHTNTIEYIMKNRDEKIILIGTSCLIYSIKKLIEMYKLNRENYLLIGLFCDKTMTYNVYDYFKKFDKNKSLNELIFRTKKAGGWPGNIILNYADNSYLTLSSKERTQIKEYFQPERCLYCLDKLNQFADISLGDNYVKENMDKSGSNSVILRTELSLDIWDKVKDYVIYNEESIDNIIKSQNINLRRKNLINAKIKGINISKNWDSVNVDNKSKKEYKRRIYKIKLGQSIDINKIQSDIKKQKIINKFNRIISKFK